MLYENKTNQTLTFTLNDGSENGREVHLGPGKTEDLPAENDYIKGLVGYGYLVAVPQAEVPPSKTK